MIIAPNRYEPINEDNGEPELRFSEFLEEMTDKVNTLVGNTDEYTAINVTTDRAFDANAAAGSITSPPTQAEVENIRDAVLELADVVGTLIEDLQSAGVIA